MRKSGFSRSKSKKNELKATGERRMTAVRLGTNREEVIHK